MASENLISGLAKAECVKCKAIASKPLFMVPGFDTNAIALVHEDWCPFLKAVQASQKTAIAWVEKNGYPVNYYLDDRIVPVAYRTKAGWAVHPPREK
jgi:hypothetical protein